MNQDELMSQDGSIPLLVKCACGCGKEFRPKYRWHKYYSDKCRMRGWLQKKIKNAENEELKNLRSRLDKLEKKLEEGE